MLSYIHSWYFVGEKELSIDGPKYLRLNGDGLHGIPKLFRRNDIFVSPKTLFDHAPLLFFMSQTGPDPPRGIELPTLERQSCRRHAARSCRLRRLH